MFNTIVVATDGSENARKAESLAFELAKRDGGKLVFVHVDEHTIGKGGGAIHPDEEKIQGEIRKRAEELGADGVETDVAFKDIMVGGAAHPIAEVADEQNADLIVAGTRGHSSISGLLLGSVAQRLLHLAHQPVLVVPSD